MAFNCIAQNVIDNLPIIRLEGITQDENRFVNDWLKFALQYAKDCNNSNEVGVMLDKTDWNNFDYVCGTKDKVIFNTDKMVKWQDKGNNNLVFIHTHPSNSIFSNKDFYNFCRTISLNTLIVVGNKGTVYMIQKLDGFDKYKVIQYYSESTRLNKHKFSRRKLLELTLITYQDKLNIKFEKETIS